jgi:hypothetical protein
MHLGRLAIFFGVLAIVGVISALSERKTRMKLRALRDLRKR